MVCSRLLNPALYRSLGVVPPRGLLLHGPSGVGKRLMVQVVAAMCGAEVRWWPLRVAWRAFESYLGFLYSLFYFFFFFFSSVLLFVLRLWKCAGRSACAATWATARSSCATCLPRRAARSYPSLSISPRWKRSRPRRTHAI